MRRQYNALETSMLRYRPSNYCFGGRWFRKVAVKQALDLQSGEVLAHGLSGGTLVGHAGMRRGVGRCHGDWIGKR